MIGNLMIAGKERHHLFEWWPLILPCASEIQEG
jgi:hypothetical protein